jgi:ABC-2 type transport system permease protein
VPGVAAVYLVSAVIAIAVGILLRNTAGAVAGLLMWMLVAETALAIIPNDEGLLRWLPFKAALLFLYGSRPMFSSGPLSGPWGELAYVTTFAAALLVVALLVANRRDA